MKSLDGAVVVITGAGSGIGRALALNLAQRGAVLALSDWDEVGLVETARQVQAVVPHHPAHSGREARTDKLDVRDRDAMRTYAASVREQFGRVNVIVNNAGVALHGDFEETDYEDFAWVLEVDFWGVVQGTKEFLPYLIESGDGHVVNVSSLFGLLGVPGQTSYNAAKFAVRGFTEALRQELLIAKRPVQVTCVHPGGIKTAIARNARATASHDVAEVARYFDTRLARTSPERAAEVIVAGMLANKPRVLIGADAKLLDAFVRLVGPRYQRVVARAAGRAAPGYRRVRGGSRAPGECDQPRTDQ
ncbi:MAG TPA: SDR family NAD(P)-dependent oxidoreductase [Nocardioidaceae bacterium]|nr:SDR family NAD(P)-dependent oxidoreductase [Nocardioidaceae bacterium]